MPFEFPKPENKPADAEKRKAEKLAKLESIREEIEKLADHEGKPIDPGIKETVIALNALEFNTAQSCEGHTENGMNAPWIRVDAPGKPSPRFNRQAEVFAEVAEKYGVPLETLKRGEPREYHWEALKEAAENGETPEYAKWLVKAEELRARAGQLLEEFYRKRPTPEGERIKIGGFGGGEFVIHAGGENYADVPEDIDDAAKAQLSAKLKEYRAEMDAFAGFLKDRFLADSAK